MSIRLKSGGEEDGAIKRRTGGRAGPFSAMLSPLSAPSTERTFAAAASEGRTDDVDSFSPTAITVLSVQS